jgi:serine protease Do
MVFPERTGCDSRKKFGWFQFLCLASLAVLWTAAGNHILAQTVGAEQETGTVKIVNDAEAESSETVSLEFLDTGAEPTSLAQLKAMEPRVRDVSEKVFRATVNIQMGNSQGTGVIVSDDGYILTAAHVIGRPNNKATVVLFDGTELKATALGVNRSIDSGMMKIDIDENSSQTFPWLDIAESSTLVPGSWVMAVGHPGGLDPRRGMVVRVGRLLASNAQLMRTDCTLVGGDSGGPLVDLNGELIGIHSRIGNNLWENIHVPIDSFSMDWDRLAKSEIIGGSQNPYLGLSVVDATNEVESVESNGPADKAGIQKGDVVVRIESTEVKDRGDIARAMRRVKIGDIVKVTVKRNDGEIVLDLKVGEN